VPGERTIWFEDFADDAVGDFPRRMGLIDGNLEVVDVKGHHYLRSADGGTVAIQLPEMLPERFTVEALFYGSGNPLMLHTTRDFNLTYFGCYHDQAFVHATNDADSHQTIDGLDPHAFIHCRFTIDRRYIKGYLNERRLANLPVADLPRTDSLVIQVPGSGDEDAALVTDIRVAAGGKKLYDLLLADGHVATHGILFATGSAQIRGESTPTLKEIGEMLATHADLRLVIEGHTDNVGNAAANLQLSRQRAEAVSAYLVSNYHVDPARLETRGLGDTKPVDTNATPEGRQNNRRVELVKR
jgi:outer membrane protein OmpA-like peptidoglycan-associated protein